MPMQPLASFPGSAKTAIRFVLTDIDDTLTVDGRLPSTALSAMEALQRAGIRVIPITGRPAGWCDHIARMWPVDGIVGENGAFYFHYDNHARKMLRRYWKPTSERMSDRLRLDAIRDEILAAVPGCAVSADQPYREADLAIDFCEDVPALPMAMVEKIVAIFHRRGAAAKISSIHVNGWFGGYDKLSMTRRLFGEVFHEDLDEIRNQMVFCGDSPNDAPMFAYFPHSVGVANIQRFLNRMTSPPAWVTPSEGGYGFAEMARMILDR